MSGRRRQSLEKERHCHDNSHQGKPAGVKEGLDTREQ